MAGPLPLKTMSIYQRGEFRVLRVLAKELIIRRGACAAVEVFVDKSDKAFVEERVALTRHLHPWANGDSLL